MNSRTQVVLIPPHVAGDISNPDCEYGFVTKMHSNGKDAYCRYWSRNKVGQLRTKANSELTPLSMLVPCESVMPERVEYVIKKYKIEVS